MIGNIGGNNLPSSADETGEIDDFLEPAVDLEIMIGKVRKTAMKTPTCISHRCPKYRLGITIIHNFFHSPNFRR